MVTFRAFTESNLGHFLMALQRIEMTDVVRVKECLRPRSSTLRVYV